MLHRQLLHDGITREYFVFIPKAISGHQPLPVLLAIHGYGSTATGFQASYALNRHASKAGYIAVYPQGSHFQGVLGEEPAGDPFLITSWNDLSANRSLSPAPNGPHCTADRLAFPCPPECGQCGRCDWVSCYDDVGFLTRVLDAVAAEFATDPHRYYLLGVSNGAMMALRMGCHLPRRFAAMTAIIGQPAPGYECAPGVDLPLLHLYGGKDDVVGFDGSPTSDGWIFASAVNTVATWARGLECAASPTTWDNRLALTAGLNCAVYDDCRVNSHQVVSCMAPDTRHEWVGQRIREIPANCVGPEQRASFPEQPPCPPGRPAKALWGMELAWRFMSRYRR